MRCVITEDIPIAPNAKVVTTKEAPIHPDGLLTQS